MILITTMKQVEEFTHLLYKANIEIPINLSFGLNKEEMEKFKKSYCNSNLLPFHQQKKVLTQMGAVSVHLVD